MSQGSMVIAAEDLKGQCGMIQTQREKIVITKRSQQECFRKRSESILTKEKCLIFLDFHTKAKAFVGLWFYSNVGSGQFWATIVAIRTSA